MAWRCRFLTARPCQGGHVIAETDFVKNCRVYPTHWLISTQVMEARPTMDLPRTIAKVLDLPLRGTLERRPWWEALVWPRGAGTDVLLRSHPVWKS